MGDQWEAEGLPERVQDHDVWRQIESVEVEIEVAEDEAFFAADSKLGRIRSRWRGSMAAIAVVAAIACIAIAAKGNATSTPIGICFVVVVTHGSLVILNRGHGTGHKRKNPPEPGDHAAGQGSARSPPEGV